MVLVLNLPIPGVKAQIPEQQKQTVLVQTYIFTWILLVYATAAASKTGMGGFYLITMWNVVVFLACCIGGAEGMVGAQGTHPVVVILQQPTPAEERTDNFEEVDENTPLIPRTRHDVTILGGEETGAIGWWIIQILVVIPVPLILVSHITTMLVGAMSQTLADGSSPVTGQCYTSVIASPDKLCSLRSPCASSGADADTPRPVQFQNASNPNLRLRRRSCCYNALWIPQLPLQSGVSSESILSAKHNSLASRNSCHHYSEWCFRPHCQCYFSPPIRCRQGCGLHTILSKTLPATMRLGERYDTISCFQFHFRQVA